MPSLHDVTYKIPQSKRVILDAHGCFHGGNGDSDRQCNCRYVGPDDGSLLQGKEYYQLADIYWASKQTC